MGLKIIRDNNKNTHFPGSEEIIKTRLFYKKKIYYKIMNIPRLPTDLIISILKERKNMIEKEKEEIKNNKINFNNTIKELNDFYDCFFDRRRIFRRIRIKFNYG
jgi:formylmethanofuran dehydrogenase subunit C